MSRRRVPGHQPSADRAGAEQRGRSPADRGTSGAPEHGRSVGARREGARSGRARLCTGGARVAGSSRAGVSAGQGHAAARCTGARVAPRKLGPHTAHPGSRGPGVCQENDFFRGGTRAPVHQTAQWASDLHERCARIGPWTRAPACTAVHRRSASPVSPDRPQRARGVVLDEPEPGAHPVASLPRAAELDGVAPRGELLPQGGCADPLAFGDPVGGAPFVP